MIRGFATLWVLVSLVVALCAYLDVSMLGFPDGYLTPYERATRPARWMLAGASLAVAIIFAGLRAVDREPRGRAFALVVGMSALHVLGPAMTLPQCPRIAACAAAVEFAGVPIADDGIGG